MTTHKIAHSCMLDVPKFGSEIGREAESVTIAPHVISSRWTRNSHLEADELELTLGWDDSGTDVRTLKHARVLFYMWDQNLEDFDLGKHLRFVGICKRAKRSGGENGDVTVTMTFQDYTALFLETRNFPADGIPDWSDTLQTAWDRICDHTGWYDIDEGEIVSSVADLKPRLVFRLADPSLASKKLGAAVADRFHAIGKPTPGQNANAWAVWQYCCAALGLISYIEKDECIVTDTQTHFAETDAPLAMWGGNVATIEEEANADAACKGILLKSFDPLTGRVIEAFYPPLGDPRVRTKRPNAKKRRAPSENDLANSHYQQFNYPWTTDRDELEKRAREVYDQFSRQELAGTITTAATTLETGSGERKSILDLAAGEPIAVHFNEIDPDVFAHLSDDNERRRFLLDRGYSEDMAALIVKNTQGMLRLRPVFNSKTLSVDLGPSAFHVEIRYWNRIR